MFAPLMLRVTGYKLKVGFCKKLSTFNFQPIIKFGSLGTQGVDSKYGVTKGSVDTRLGQAKDGGTDYQLV
jgi:hypothetical protein